LWTNREPEPYWVKRARGEPILLNRKHTSLGGQHVTDLSHLGELKPGGHLYLINTFGGTRPCGLGETIIFGEAHHGKRVGHGDLYWA